MAGRRETKKEATHAELVAVATRLFRERGFDHTSVTRLLELVTGVVNPGITAWRRKSVGDFTAALGTVPDRRFPRLPGTTRQLELAEQQVTEFPLPPIPGADQTFPIVPPGSKPVRKTSAAANAAGA